MEASEKSFSATILVVDDTPTNLSVLVGILENSGYRILVARNGHTALDIARRTHPDLMLLDIAMPEMNGFEVCRLLKQDPETAGTTIIFLSALSDVEDKVSGLNLGAVDYITKPFQSEEVLARVRGQLSQRQLQQELRESRDSLSREMRSAGDMQKLLLPRSFPACGSITFAAHYRTSTHAGGDYYDVLPLKSPRIGVFLADVSGHGARATVLMAMMRTLLHSSGVPLEDPAELLFAMNHHFDFLKGSNLFATAIYAVIDPAAERMQIACAGHPAPILVRPGEPVAEIQCERTFPLFLFTPRIAPASDHEFRRGDRVLFYTDGIIERQNRAGDLLELQQFMKLISSAADVSNDSLLSYITDHIELFADGGDPNDDETILVASM